MPPEFWGLVMMQVVHVYNYLPHSSINFEIPYALQTGCVPDISWLCPFGCSVVVLQGKDLFKHHKLAPSCESGVHVGMGLMHCCKSWLVYSAWTNSVYSSTDCTFNEMLFPAKPTD
eukprot:3594237-Rhodomonas_salina.3